MNPRLVRETKSDLRMIVHMITKYPEDWLSIALRHAETALARLEAAHKTAPQIKIKVVKETAT